MAAIDTVDSIEINAPAIEVFKTVLDYPNTNSWFPMLHCRQVDNPGAKIEEGSRIEHLFGKPPYLVIDRFTRTIQYISIGDRIEETYDEGDLIGKGIWTFSENAGITTAAFHCAVKANVLSLQLTFLFSGARGHKLMFGRILKALKRQCEGKN